MRTRNYRAGLTLIGAGAMAFSSHASAAAPQSSPQAPTPTASAENTVPGWHELIDALRDLPERILARLPEAQRGDPQIRAEVGRLALSAVTTASIDALASDPDHPAFIPQLNNYITSGQPNADTSYRRAVIAPGGIYRLRGEKGSMNQAVVMESTPPTRQPSKARPIHDLNALKADAEGRYDVILSPVRPKGYSGDWWQLDPAANALLVRMVSADWDNERQPTLSIERLDSAATRPRPSAHVLEAKLISIAAFADMAATVLIDRPEKLRKEGFINTLKSVDMRALGGLSGQFYYEGAYDLTEDEALVVETMVPDSCTYRSLILTNDIYETTDWYNNHSSLNGAQAAVDKDGVLRIVISQKDPGVKNWLDTAGYPSGVVQGRWVGCTTPPVPTVRKLQMKDVIAALPKGTAMVSPQEREQLVRDRRATLQQKSLW